MLAPEMIEAILSGTQREDLQVEHFRGTMPLEWHEQLKQFT